ncbi:MAG: hypothetical protein ACKO1Y_04250 [Actinomycetota bacterium]
MTAATVTGLPEPSAPVAAVRSRIGEQARAAGRAVLPCLLMVVGAAFAWP